MTIKVLRLDYWMYVDSVYDSLLGSNRYPSRPQVFNRNGIYLRGKECWAEVNGKAFAYPKRTFLYTLNNLHAGEYNEEEYNALKVIKSVGLATKEQREWLHRIRDYKSIMASEREAKKCALRFQKRYSSL